MPMTPALRSRVIDALGEIVPTPDAVNCMDCDLSGGCVDEHGCRRELCEQILAVIEREGGFG